MVKGRMKRAEKGRKAKASGVLGRLSQHGRLLAMQSNKEGL